MLIVYVITVIDSLKAPVRRLFNARPQNSSGYSKLQAKSPVTRPVLETLSSSKDEDGDTTTGTVFFILS